MPKIKQCRVGGTHLYPPPKKKVRKMKIALLA